MWGQTRLGSAFRISREYVAFGKAARGSQHAEGSPNTWLLWVKVIDREGELSGSPLTAVQSRLRLLGLFVWHAPHPHPPIWLCFYPILEAGGGDQCQSPPPPSQAWSNGVPSRSTLPTVTDPRGPSERKPCLSAGLAWENVSLGCSGAIFLPTWRQPVDRMKPHAEASRAETEFETQKETDRGIN